MKRPERMPPPPEDAAQEMKDDNTPWSKEKELFARKHERPAPTSEGGPPPPVHEIQDQDNFDPPPKYHNDYRVLPHRGVQQRKKPKYFTPKIDSDSIGDDDN